MKRRLLALLVVVIVQLTLPVWFGASPASNGPFVDTSTLADGDSDHVGETAQVYGQVESLDPVVVRHHLDDGAQYYFEVTDIDAPVEVGAYVEVYGVITAADRIAAESIVVRGEREHWYTYGVSVLAVLVVLVSLASSWRIDMKRLTLVPAEERDA